MIKLDDRHFGESRQSRRLKTAVSGKDRPITIDNYGIAEAEFSYVLSELPDLLT